MRKRGDHRVEHSSDLLAAIGGVDDRLGGDRATVGNVLCAPWVGEGMGEAASVQPLRSSSFDDVYLDEFQGMVRLAYLIVRSRAIAEELVQEAFVRLHADFAGIGNPGGFLRVALVRLCLTWKRRAVLESAYLDSIAEPGPTGEPVIDETWDVLARLSSERRTAIVLRFYADLSHDQIAGVTGWRVATVRTRVHRGLLDLRKELDR
jgi:RNA polymerase sigma factor (sigma-70 family)